MSADYLNSWLNHTLSLELSILATIAVTVCMLKIFASPSAKPLEEIMAVYLQPDERVRIHTADESIPEEDLESDDAQAEDDSMEPETPQISVDELIPADARAGPEEVCKDEKFPEKIATTNLPTWSSTDTVHESSPGTPDTASKTTDTDDAAAAVIASKKTAAADANAVTDLQSRLLLAHTGEDLTLRQQAEIAKDGMLLAISQMYGVVKNMDVDATTREAKVTAERDGALARASRAETELETVRQQLTTALLTLDSLSEETIRLRAALSTLHNANKDHFLHAKSDLVAARQELADAQTSISLRDEHILTLEDTTATLKAAVEEHRSRLHIAKSEALVLRHELYGTKMELEFAQGSIKALQRAVAEAKASSSSSGSDVETASNGGAKEKKGEGKAAVDYAFLRPLSTSRRCSEKAGSTGGNEAKAAVDRGFARPQAAARCSEAESIRDVSSSSDDEWPEFLQEVLEVM